MKKLYILVAVAATLCLASCSKSPKDYMDDLSKLKEQYRELIDENKPEEAEKVKAKFYDIMDEMGEKAKNNPEFSAAVKKYAVELAEQNELEESK